MDSNVVPFRRKPVLVWEDDGRVHEIDGQIYPGFVARTADDIRYEIVPCCRMKFPSGFEFAFSYAVSCHWTDPYRFQGYVGTWTRVGDGSFPMVDAAKAAAQQHYEWLASGALDKAMEAAE